LDKPKMVPLGELALLNLEKDLEIQRLRKLLAEREMLIEQLNTSQKTVKE